MKFVSLTFGNARIRHSKSQGQIGTDLAFTFWLSIKTSITNDGQGGVLFKSQGNGDSQLSHPSQRYALFICCFQLSHTSQRHQVSGRQVSRCQAAMSSAVVVAALVLIALALVWECMKQCLRFSRRMMTVLFGKEDVSHQSPRRQMDYVNPSCRPMYPAGFCTLCRAATHCPWHCRGCGSHTNNSHGGGGGSIIVHYFEDGADAHVCTNCFLVPRLPWHCDRCGGGSSHSIITLQT